MAKASWMHHVKPLCVKLRQVWDPWLIIAQIISVQCLFYLSLGLFQMLFIGELHLS